MSAGIFVPPARHSSTSPGATVVELDDADMQMARWLARERGKSKRHHGVRSVKVDGRQDDIVIDLVGMMGEIAVARYLGVDVDDRIGLAGDGGIADLAYGGKSIQVKATKHPRGRLVFGGPCDFLSDVAVLAIVDTSPVVRLAGWASRETFNARHFVADLGYGDRRCMDQSALEDMRALKADGGIDRLSTGWPYIPPRYLGWSFHGSPFPSYDDPEFADFQRYSAEQVAIESAGSDRCETHGRPLTYYEYKAGGCFDCVPWLDDRPKRRRAAERPSGSDGDGVVQLGLS